MHVLQTLTCHVHAPFMQLLFPGTRTYTTSSAIYHKCVFDYPCEYFTIRLPHTQQWGVLFWAMSPEVAVRGKHPVQLPLFSTTLHGPRRPTAPVQVNPRMGACDESSTLPHGLKLFTPALPRLTSTPVNRDLML